MSTHDEVIWLHELRNSVNTACVALDVAKRSLEASELERARTFLAHAELACDRSRRLLAQPNRPLPREPDEGSQGD